MLLLRSAAVLLLLGGGLAATRATAADAPSNAVVRFPTSETPAAGWPVVVLLTSDGLGVEDFFQFASICAARGVATILVETDRSPGEQWMDGFDEGFVPVEPSLDFIARDARLNPQRVIIGGFSRGAYQSLVLANRYPEKFAGVLAMSPAGETALPTMWSGLRRTQQLYVIEGSLESQPTSDLVLAATSQWSAAGMPVKVRKVLGGHHLPKHLADELALALEWLVPSGC